VNERKLSKISAALKESVKKDCKNDVTISFSGGIDSTLVAFLAKKYKNVELIAVGVKNSYDIEAAKSAAKLINLDLTVKEISDDEFVSEALILQKKLNLTQFEVEFMLPFWIAAKNAKNPILMCGQGADEVFGGYARFRESKNNSSLDKEIKSLLEIIPKREEKIAEILNYAESDYYSDEERAVLDLAFASGRAPNISNAAHFNELKKYFSDDQIIDIVSVISMFGFLNRWNDTLGTKLEDVPRDFVEEKLKPLGWS